MGGRNVKKRFTRFIIFIGIIIFFILKKGHFGTNNIIVIDPGHGGQDPGTIGVNGNYEKDINLEISKKLYKKLREMGYKVVLTRKTDESVDNLERAKLANKKRARVFVSIHCNSVEKNNATNGIQVLYYPNRKSHNNDPNNEVLANLVLEQALIRTGAENKGIVERKDLIVLNQTKMPAIIVECGFLSNGNEANLLIDDEYQNKIVDGIVEGLGNYIR